MLKTKEQFMKGLSTLQKVILIDTKEQFMKGWTTLVSSVKLGGRKSTVFGVTNGTRHIKELSIDSIFI